MRPFAAYISVFVRLVLFGTLPVLHAQEESLVPVRDWTSTDGKTMRAALITFEKGQGQFRTPEGRRFVIPDDRLSLRDQVEILVARLHNQFEVSYSQDINTDFYYSKHVPANRRAEKIYGYLGFGPGRFNMAITLNDPDLDFGQFDGITVPGANGTPDGVYQLLETDVRKFTRNGKERTYARIPFVVGQNEELFRSIESALAANSLTFVAKGRNMTTTFELDEPEKNGLRETCTAYRQASQLIKEGFLKKERLGDQSFDAVSQSTPNPSTGNDALEPFRKSLSQKKYGALEWKSEPVDGVGFLGTDVVVRRRDGEIARAPFLEISEEGRKRLFEQRIEESFGKSKHEYSAGITVFLHPDWDSQRMTYSRSILLTRNLKGEYFLRAFAWAANMNGASVKEIFIRGDQLEKPFSLACDPKDSYTRERTDGARNTLVGTYLNTTESASASGLTGSGSIQFRIRSEENQDVSATLQDDELHTTLEAIALFQWARQL